MKAGGGDQEQERQEKKNEKNKDILSHHLALFR